jgi:hypothetical protein
MQEGYFQVMALPVSTCRRVKHVRPDTAPLHTSRNTGCYQSLRSSSSSSAQLQTSALIRTCVQETLDFSPWHRARLVTKL